MSAEVFYVTIRRGTRTGFLLGPYSTKTDAETDVDPGRELARRNPFTWFGVTEVTVNSGKPLPRGILNDLATAAQQNNQGKDA